MLNYIERIMLFNKCRFEPLQNLNSMKTLIWDPKNHQSQQIKNTIILNYVPNKSRYK